MIWLKRIAYTLMWLWVIFFLVMVCIEVYTRGQWQGFHL